MKYRRDSILTVFVLMFVVLCYGCSERPLDTPTPQMDAAEEFWIRVLVVDDVSKFGLSIRSGFVVEWNRGKKTKRFAKRTEVISGGLIEGRISIGTEVFDDSEVVVIPESPHIFELDGVKYRGRLKILVDDRGLSFSLINEVPLKPYLAGVIGAEMPSYWEPAALEAQAIASRSYCLYIKRRFGVNRSWDVRRSEASQVYVGLSGECVAVWSAVNSTAGEVLYGKDTENHEVLLPTYYSSSCGGHTENSKHVFGDSFESLAGVACDYCRKVARPKFFFWPVVRIDKDQVSRRLIERYPDLTELERIVDIVVVGQSEYEHFTRWTFIKLIGENGKSSFVRAEDFRLSVNPSGRKLRSTAWEMENLPKQWGFLSGRGYGHGVGMCQCGAEGMAREGKSAKEILSHYYPGSRIRDIY